MKKFVNHTAAFLLALALLISLFPMTAFAAESWPRLSPTGFCEMVAPAKVNVYMDSNLSTRGAVGSEQSYNAYVAAGDLIRIYQVTSDYTLLKYPTSNGRCAGYVRTSDLFGRSEPAEAFSSATKVTTYSYNNTSSKSGSVAVGDSVYRLGCASGDYILIMYTAESGARAYKAAFVTRNDYDKIKGSSSSNGSGSSNSSGGTQSMSYALYNGNGGRVTCGFDGYVNTKGRHEGIDFAMGEGSAVYSLTDGVITRITEGKTGSSGLSTIAVYYSSANKTVVYLHTNPEDSLYVGQNISRGQQIATESWRGISSSSGTHTHVEVRDGKRTGAAKSVNDYTLDNPNPTSFWEEQGYTIN